MLDMLNWLAVPANQKSLAMGVFWVFLAWGAARTVVSTINVIVTLATRPFIRPPKL